MEDFIELDRRFRDLTDKERSEPAMLAAWGSQEPEPGIPWTELLKSERIVLLAEAGSGKTWEMRAQAARLKLEGKDAFFIAIEALEKEDVRDYLSMEEGEAERFDAWLAGNETAWFFLDAVDELKLINGKLSTALGKLDRAIRTAKRRARIIVSCRPTDWRPVEDMRLFQSKFPVSDTSESADALSSDEAFLAPLREQTTPKEAPKPPIEKFRCVVLLPLGERQIETFADASGVSDPRALLSEIKRKEAWSFARRPQDLRGLIGSWTTKGTLGSRLQQHQADVENSLRDAPDRPDQGVLPPDKAQQGAERLALAMMLTKRRTIRAPEQIGAEPTDTSSLDAEQILTDWTQAEVRALLRRSIFDPATYGRVRFHHRSVQEFLAAQRLESLLEAGMTKKKLRSLIFADTYGEKVVIPSMRPIAGWLSRTNSDVWREVLRREPEVLILFADPESLSLEVRSALVRDYVATYSSGGWRGLSMPIAEFQRLAKPDLATEIKRAWDQKHSNEEVREFLLKLVWLGAIQDCAEIAYDTLMDFALEPYTRVLAARALGECRRNDLLRLAADDMLKDQSRWPDRVVHSSADDLFPNVISTSELEQLIRRTREPRNTVGGFSWTLYQLAGAIEPGSDAATLVRDMLAKLVWDGRNEASPSYQPASSFSYIAPALVRLCARQMESRAVKSSELVWASVVGNRFYGDNTLGREHLQSLGASFGNDAAIREATFWFEFKVRQGIGRGEKRDDLPYWIYSDGLLQKAVQEDWPWLLRALRRRRPRAKRDVALHVLIDLWAYQGRSNAKLKELKKAVADDKRLTVELDNRTTKRPMTAEQKKREQEAKKWELEHKQRLRRRAEQQRRIEKSWSDWKVKAEAEPAACFRGKRAEKSMWILLRWLEMSGRSNSHLGLTNWNEIRQILGDVIAEGFAAILKTYWRKTEPPVWSRLAPDRKKHDLGQTKSCIDRARD